jgi:hypothetical protein
MIQYSKSSATVEAANPFGDLADFSIFEFGAQIEEWFNLHYLELLWAALVGGIIFFVLGGMKRYAARYVRNNEGLTGYRKIISKAIAKTS